MSAHVGTLFVLRWDDIDEGEVERDFVRRKDAMSSAAEAALRSVQGTAFLSMLVEEDLREHGGSGGALRMTRSWEVSADGATQVSGARERGIRR